MEMKRTRRAPSPTPPPSSAIDLEDVDLAAAERRPPPSPPTPAKPSPRILLSVLLACVLLLPTLAVVLIGAHGRRLYPGGDQLVAAEIAGDLSRRHAEVRDAGDARARSMQAEEEEKSIFEDLNDGAFKFISAPRDKLLGGLLASGFNEASCLSRYQSVLYRKESPHRPSPYLLERIRKYEALHKRCGPGTDSFGKALDQLKTNQTNGPAECKYVVWVSYSGLGNKILTLASTFLYALLSERVLLVDRGGDMANLFCEPFPDSTWFLPWDFPVNQFNIFDQKSLQSYGSMLKSKVFDRNAVQGSIGSMPSYVYIHLAHDYDDDDKLFFCSEDQRILDQIPWTILRSDNYFVPSLFLSPSFQEELSRLFPEKDTVFHHVARYLLHPTNPVWGLITRYYQVYLARADETIGIQIRVFDDEAGPFQHVLDQILSCSSKEKLLPKVNYNGDVLANTKGKSKAVLLTSLNSGYFENLRNMFWEHPTENGEVIGIFQPSHEEYQQTEKPMHNMKAWAEMYLLSLTDKLVISSWSTFGYVAQGLGGLKSWILVKPENMTVPDPPCRLAMSCEPCFHAPPFYDCKEKRGADTGALLPHVRHCEDMSWGLKLVNRDEW